MTQALNLSQLANNVNSSGVLATAGGGTGVTSSTGSGANVLATSPTLVTPNLGTPSAINLSNATALPYAALPTGSVLQVVNATYSTQTSTTSASLVDTGLSATITPKFSTSKILVLVNVSGVFSNTPTVGQFTITDGSNNILLGFEGLAGYLNANSSFGCASSCYQHSPATSSAFTYKVRMANVAGSGISMNGVTSGSTTSTITLMEVAG